MIHAFYLFLFYSFVGFLLEELEFPIILPESKEKWLVSYCVDRKRIRKSKLYFYDT